MTDKPHSDRSVKLLSWLFPATLLAHITEEYWGGLAFSSSPSSMRGVNLTPAMFLLMTGLAWALMVTGIFLARKFNFPELFLVLLGTIVLINGLSHTISSIVGAEYNPGLISGLLIWIPLGGVTLALMKRRMGSRRYWLGVVAGAAIHGVVSLLALGGGSVRGV